MRSWTDKYLEMQFASCIHLVQHVVETYLRIRKDLPSLENHHALMGNRSEWARRVPQGEPLRDGMIVLMRPDSPVMHAGVLCLDAGPPAVLHTIDTPGFAVRQPLRLAQRVFRVEGFYEVLP
jgi:hypothetical protein